MFALCVCAVYARGEGKQSSENVGSYVSKVAGRLLLRGLLNAVLEKASR